MIDFKKVNKNQMLLGVAVLAIVVTAVLISAKSSPSGVLSWINFGGMSDKQIAQQSIDYLNKSVLQNGQTATLVSVTDASGVVKMKIQIGGTSYDSYASKDGKLLFPEAFTLAPTATTPTAASNSNQTAAAQQTPQNTTTAVAKVAKTALTAYVVSSCPFGLQMQRAIAGAISKIPSLAQYITVRYIGAVSGNTITSMHGNEEAQENLRQMCIREEQPAKYWTYVGCYMKNAVGQASNGMPYGDSKTCQQTAGIDSTKLNACVADPARGLAYAKADFALDTKYGVQGSPTLVLNGSQISETPFGGRAPDAIKNIICDSSTNPPDFCSTKLDTNQATTSFSLTMATSNTATASANTNCATTTN